MADTPGVLRGRHFTSYVTHVENLKSSGYLKEAEKLLLELVSATESESKVEHCGVAPWYYEQLAKIYRKQKDTKKEIAILERFEQQKHAPGVKSLQLTERLRKLQTLSVSSSKKQLLK